MYGSCCSGVSALSSPLFELFAAVTIAFFHGWSAAIASAGQPGKSDVVML